MMHQDTSIHCGVAESGHETRVDTGVLVSGDYTTCGVDANSMGINSEGVARSQLDFYPTDPNNDNDSCMVCGQYMASWHAGSCTWGYSIN